MNRQYIRSERAHYMCPNMHFGIRFSLHSVFEPQKIREILELLAAAHPFLRALVQREDGTDNLFYNVTDESKIQCSSLADETKVEQAWGCIAISEWNVFVEGLLKVFSCPTQEGTTVLFAAHHLLTDGRGLLELVCEFTDCLADGKTPKFAEEHLIASMDDLPKESELAFVSRVLVDRAGKRWRKENHPVSYAQYLKFSVFFGETHPVDYRFDICSSEKLCPTRKAKCWYSPATCRWSRRCWTRQRSLRWTALTVRLPASLAAKCSASQNLQLTVLPILENLRINIWTSPSLSHLLLRPQALP